MEFQVKKLDGSNDSKVKVDKSVFGVEPNEAVVHQTIQTELSNMRQGTHAAKSRGMVRGGGKKPWRQKGRGVARAGSTRSPIWKGGGTVFGPEPHLYKKSLPKKMKQIARRSVLSSKAKNDAIVVLNAIDLDQPRTKLLSDLLKKLGLDGKKVTLLTGSVNDNLFMSARNIPNVNVMTSVEASAYDLLDNEVLVFDKNGLSLLNEQLTVKN